MPDRDWSDRALKDGGRQLLNGWKATAIQLRGDWEFYCQVLGFPTATQEPNNCWLCNASPTGRLLWSASEHDAPWRATI
eukprot:5328277-Pyramimonas_sp.AAC.1